MVQIVQDRPGAAERLGSAFGTGLAGGLQSLLQQKLQGLQQQKTARGLQALGYLPEQALALGGLEAPLLSQILKSKLEEPKISAQAQFLQSQGLPAELINLPAPAQKAFIQQLLPQVESSRIEELLNTAQQLPQQKEQVSENLQQQLGINVPEDTNLELEPSTPRQLAAYDERQKNFNTEPNENFSETKREIKQFTQAEPNDYELAPMAQAAREIKAITEKLSDANLTPKDRALLNKQLENIEKKYSDKQDKIDKKYTPYVDELRKKASANEKVNQEVEKLLALVNTGKLTGPLKGSILETLKHGVFGVGLDLFSVTSPETQEFKKIQTNLLRNIKDWFGARISNQEVQRFMESLPSLNQTDEGKRRVIRDIQLLNQGEIAKKNSLEEILKENGGNIPKNLPRLVEERAAPELNRIAQEFKELYTSPQYLARQQEVRKRGPILGPLTATIEDYLREFTQ